MRSVKANETTWGILTSLCEINYFLLFFFFMAAFCWRRRKLGRARRAANAGFVRGKSTHLNRCSHGGLGWERVCLDNETSSRQTAECLLSNRRLCDANRWHFFWLYLLVHLYIWIFSIVFTFQPLAAYEGLLCCNSVSFLSVCVWVCVCAAVNKGQWGVWV